jgi:8-oxo-dGTP diphosphatase
MFNLRVYGILITEDNQVLVSDEYIRGNYYTKFPGGGLEFGEGTRDCLAREFMEEMNLKVRVGEHLYQIISIYYRVYPLEEIAVPLRDRPFDFDERQMAIYHDKKETETFRLIPMEEFSSESVTLPIDKVVSEMVRSLYP